jgi:membrane-bound lytic murein transglycosylase A
VCLTDPIDAYLAHVNGSAFIELPDGAAYRRGLRRQERPPYTSLGKELESDGKIATGQASLRTIRAWAASASNEEIGEYLNRNQSYVFFTPIDGTPHGSLESR